MQFDLVVAIKALISKIINVMIVSEVSKEDVVEKEVADSIYKIEVKRSPMPKYRGITDSTLMDIEISEVREYQIENGFSPCFCNSDIDRDWDCYPCRHKDSCTTASI